MSTTFHQPLEVLYEDNHLIAVNKPARVLVHGDITGDQTLADQVKAYIKEKYQKPGDVYLGVVHRIDRPVSGVMVFARTSKALSRMEKLFRERAVEKEYWALVAAQPPVENGRLVHYLKKDTDKNKAVIWNKERPGTKKCELTYQLQKSKGGKYLLAVHPLTGRPHQIRVQLASLGCPIIGDLKYGFPHAVDDGAICLHARSIHFLHPVKKEPLTIVAPLPKAPRWQHF